MSPFDVLMLVYQLLVPLSMFLGLWIAARWLPDVSGWLAGIGAGAVASSRAAQVVAWIALGAFFANPIMDVLRTLVTVIQLAVRPAGDTGTMSTVWGQGSFSVYSGIATFMTLVIYLLVVWAGYRLWPEAAEEEASENTSLALEEWFVLFAVASLVNRFILDIVQSVIWLPVPNYIDMGRLSSVGFIGAWLIGLGVVAIVLLILVSNLRKTPQAS